MPASAPRGRGPAGDARVGLCLSLVARRTRLWLRTWVFRDSLRRRIVLQTMGGLLLAFGVFGALGIWAVQESIDRTLQERLILGRAVASHVDYVLRDSVQSLDAVTLAEGLDIEGSDPEPRRQALRAAKQRSGFSGVYLLDRAGRVIWAEPESLAQPGRDLSPLAHVRNALATGWSGVTAAYPRGPGSTLAVSLVVPVRSQAGQLVGVVIGELELPSIRLQQIIRPVGLGQTARVDLVDREGVVIASTDDSYLLQPSDHRHELAALIDARRSTVGTCHSCHDAAPARQREAEVMALAPLGATDWGVVVRESEREALAPARWLQQRIILLGGPLFLAAMTVAGYTSRRIARSIGQLNSAAERIARGDLDIPTPHQTGEDEISRLARTLDAMRLGLKASLERVQQLNADLEARVHRRTEELTRSEAELRHRNAELSVLNEQIRRKEADRGMLLQKVIGAQEEERKRIARDLHDDTSQTLAALLVALETAEGSPGKTEAERQIANARSLASQALVGIQKVTFDLRPSLLDDLGLVAALRWFAESRLAPAGVKVYFEVDGPDQRVAPEIETTVFRIVQEAITNLARHARAETAAVRLEFGDAALTVEVEDDGQGFVVDPGRPPPIGGRGLGLLGMAERAALVGGTLEVQSRLGRGTTVRVRVPIRRPNLPIAAAVVPPDDPDVSPASTPVAAGPLSASLPSLRRLAPVPAETDKLPESVIPVRRAKQQGARTPTPRRPTALARHLGEKATGVSPPRPEMG